MVGSLQNQNLPGGRLATPGPKLGQGPQPQIRHLSANQTPPATLELVLGEPHAGQQILSLTQDRVEDQLQGLLGKAKTNTSLFQGKTAVLNVPLPDNQVLEIPISRLNRDGLLGALQNATLNLSQSDAVAFHKEVAPLVKLLRQGVKLPPKAPPLTIRATQKPIPAKAPKTAPKTESPRFSPKTARKSMAQRGRKYAAITTPDQLREALASDVQLFKSRYSKARLSKNHFMREIATKILFQDLALLEKTGNLSQPERMLYQQLYDKAMANFNAADGQFKLSMDEVAALLAIVESKAQAPNLTIQAPNTTQIDGLGKGEPQQQYATALENYDAVIDASDAAVKDMKVARREKTVLYGEGTYAVESGRTKGRVKGALNAVNQQLGQVDKLMGAVEQQIQSLQGKMDSRVLEIVLQGIEKNPKLAAKMEAAGISLDALKAGNLNAENMQKVFGVIKAEPALAKAIGSDKELASLNDQLTSASGRYQGLKNKKLALIDAKKEGLQTLRDFAVEKRNRIQRMGKVATVAYDINERVMALRNAMDNLQYLTSEIDKGTGDSTFATIFQEELLKIQQEIFDISEEVVAMLESLKQEYAKYPDVVKLLDAQILTIRKIPENVELLKLTPAEIQELKMDFPETIQDVAGIMKMFEEHRSALIEAMSQKGRLRDEEVDTLQGLDYTVEGFTGTQLAAEAQSLESLYQIDAQIEVLENQEKGLAQSSAGMIDSVNGKVSAYLEVSAGVGGEVAGGLIGGSVEASLGITLSVSKSGKDGDIPPPYKFQVDFVAKAKAEAKLLWIFGGSAEVSAKLQAGLGFQTKAEMLQFANDLQELLELALSGDIDSDRFNQLKNKVLDTIDRNAYSGYELGAGAAGKFGTDDNHIERGVSTSRSRTDYYNGRLVETSKSTTDSFAITAKGHSFKLSRTETTSRLKNDPKNPVVDPLTGEKVPNKKGKSTTLALEIDLKVMEKVLAKMEGDMLPEEVIEALFEGLKKAGKLEGMVLETFTKLLAKGLKSLGKNKMQTLRKFQAQAKNNANVTIVLSANISDNKISFGLGLAAKIEKNGSIQYGPFKGGIKAGISLEVSISTRAFELDSGAKK